MRKDLPSRSPQMQQKHSNRLVCILKRTSKCQTHPECGLESTEQTSKISFPIGKLWIKTWRLEVSSRAWRIVSPLEDVSTVSALISKNLFYVNARISAYSLPWRHVSRLWSRRESSRGWRSPAKWFCNILGKWRRCLPFSDMWHILEEVWWRHRFYNLVIWLWSAMMRWVLRVHEY